MEKFNVSITGFSAINDMHAIAFMVVNDEQMIALRDILKPHRGELFVDN